MGVTWTPTQSGTTLNQLIHGFGSQNGNVGAQFQRSNGTTANLNFTSATVDVAIRAVADGGPPVWALGQHTYTLTHDGINISHYLDGYLMNAAVLNTYTGPLYVFVYGAANTMRSMTITYIPMPAAVTGPSSSQLRYMYDNGTKYEPSTDSYKTLGRVYSINPISNAPFELIFTFSNFASTTVGTCFFGLSTVAGSGTLATSFGYSFNGTWYTYYNATSTVNSTGAPTTGNNTYTFQLIYDGSLLTYRLNGVILYSVRPLASVFAGPFYPCSFVTSNMISGSVSIRYSAIFPQTGPQGPTGLGSNSLQYAVMDYGARVNPNIAQQILFNTGLPDVLNGSGRVISSTPLIPPFTLSFTNIEMRDIAGPCAFGVTYVIT
jgi:hypothetical protein